MTCLGILVFFFFTTSHIRGFSLYAGAYRGGLLYLVDMKKRFHIFLFLLFLTDTNVDVCYI